MDSSWRASLAQDSRNRIVNRMLDTLERHTPLSGQDGMIELRKIANRFEEKIFYAATDQQDYLRKISLKMLNLEMRLQSAPNGSVPTVPTDQVTAMDDENRRKLAMDSTWRESFSQDSRNRIVNRMLDTLERHTPLCGQDGMIELRKIANRFEEKIFYAATDQHDYLRKISLKMLNLEARTQNVSNVLPPTSSSGINQSSVTPLDDVQIPMKRKSTCRGASVSNGVKRKKAKRTGEKKDDARDLQADQS